MGATSLVYWQEKLLKTQPRKIQLVWSASSGTLTPQLSGYPILATGAAISTQATINSFLGTTAEFDYLAFDATAMGTDALAVIVDMKGQAKTAVWAELKSFSSTYQVTQAGARANGGSLTASTLETAYACGDSSSITGSGNLAFKGVISGLDSLTGSLVLDLWWISK